MAQESNRPVNGLYINYDQFRQRRPEVNTNTFEEKENELLFYSNKEWYRIDKSKIWGYVKDENVMINASLLNSVFGSLYYSQKEKNKFERVHFGAIPYIVKINYSQPCLQFNPAAVFLPSKKTHEKVYILRSTGEWEELKDENIKALLKKDDEMYKTYMKETSRMLFSTKKTNYKYLMAYNRKHPYFEFVN